VFWSVLFVRLFAKRTIKLIFVTKIFGRKRNFEKKKQCLVMRFRLIGDTQNKGPIRLTLKLIGTSKTVVKIMAIPRFECQPLL
jgi:hypothetical protein